MSLLVGALLLLLGLLRGGWITQFLSRPVIIGLLAGIALNIIASQLPGVLGIGVHTSGTVIERLSQLAGHRSEINPWVLGLSLAVLTLSIACGRLGPLVPGALLALLAAAGATAVWDLGRVGVVRLQAPPTVPPTPDLGALPWGSLRELVPGALVVVILVVVQSGATEAATRQGHATLDRDLGAIGAASVVAALAGSFALNGSPPRTRMLQQARARTQVAALTAAALLALLLAFGSGLVAVLPAAALAAIQIHIALSLIRVRELRRIAAYNRMEAGVALATLLLVCTLGIIEGVAVAAALTLLDRTRREARPPTFRKGLIPQSNHWVPVDAGVATVQVPRVLVWSVEAPIWYADADYVIAQLHRELDGGDYAVVVLDTAAVSDLDYTGVLALGTLIDHLHEAEIPVLIARATRPVQRALQRAGLDAKVTLHPTVSDAVKEGAHIAGLEPEFRAARAKKKDLERLAGEPEEDSSGGG